MRADIFGYAQRRQIRADMPDTRRYFGYMIGTAMKGIVAGRVRRGRRGEEG